MIQILLEWDSWILSTIVVKFLLYVSTFLATGSMLFIFMVKPKGTAVRKELLHITVFAGLIALITIGLRIAIQAGQLLDEGIVGMMDDEMLRLVTQGPLGTVSVMHALGVLCLITAVFIIPMRIMPILIIGGALITVVSFTLIGHATKNMVILAPILALHLIAVSYWLGGIWPLYRLLGSRDTRPDAAILSQRFGQQAAFIVPILLIAGLISAYYLVGSFHALFGTPYGWLLIGKLVMVSLLLSFAAFNKMYLVSALLKGDQNSPKRLRTSIRWEALAFVIIFAVTAILTTAINLPLEF